LVQVKISAKSLTPVPTAAAAVEDAPASINHDVTNIIERQRPADTEQRSLEDAATHGGGMDSSLSDLEPGGQASDSDLPLIDLARFEIEGELGKGGMGAVQLATDRQLKRKVAIKRIHASSPSALARFVTEAQSIAALNHFNIVQIFEFGRDAEGPLLVMEYVSGGSLLDRLKEGPLEFKEAIDLTCQVCDGLAVAHQKGIIHRDIKPANILVTEEGVPKLTDFGLARQQSVDHGQTQVGAVLGTIDFMPPEQRLDATATDGRSDLWSLAATLYQMITGKSPKIIKFNNVPQSLQDVMSKALEDDPADRYQTAQEFRDALRPSLQVQHSLPVAAPVPVAAIAHPVGGEPTRHPPPLPVGADPEPVSPNIYTGRTESQLRAIRAQAENYVPRKSKFIAILLAFPLTGVFGAHNFYLGETKIAKRQLIITATLVGIYVTSVWALIDLAKIAIGSKRDVFGRELV
jgi:serine/threonine protein kinase